MDNFRCLGISHAEIRVGSDQRDMQRVCGKCGSAPEKRLPNVYLAPVIFVGQPNKVARNAELAVCGASTLPGGWADGAAMQTAPKRIT